MKPKQFPSPADLLFPPKCIICQRLVGFNDVICPDCARALPVTDSQAKQSGDFFEGCYSPFFYEEPLRASFLRYKFASRQHYSKTYGKWMADCLAGQETGGFDLITWAPLSRRRRWKRGYDQAELLARELGAQLHLPVCPTLKKAHRRPLSQLKGEKALRAARIMGAYSLRRGADPSGQRILLVDDIITSGATLSECARVLKTAGAGEIVCVTLARRRSKGKQTTH